MLNFANLLTLEKQQKGLWAKKQGDGVTPVYMAGGPGNKIPLCAHGWTHLVKTPSFPL